MNPRLLAILTSFLTIQIYAQTGLEKRIPTKASFVVSLNLSNLSQKINFNDLGNYNFLKRANQEQIAEPYSVIKELFRLSDKAGISRAGKLFIFPENHDTINNLTYLISISDAKAFESRIVDILQTKQYVPKFKKEGKLKMLTYEHKMGIMIAKDYAMLSIWDTPYYYEDDYEEYNNERSAVGQKIDSIRFANMPIDTTEIEFGDSTQEFNEIDTTSEESIEIEDEVEAPDDEEYYDSAIDSAVAMPYYDDSYDNDSLMKQFVRKWVVKRKLREDLFWVKHDTKMMTHLVQIHNLKPNEAMIKNGEFGKIISKTDDIIYWFQYESYSQQVIDLMTDKYRYSYLGDSTLLKEKLKNKPANTVDELINGNTMYGLGNFNKGEIKMNFYSGFNDNIKPFIQKIYSNTINPEFFKYIKSDNLMGLIGLSVNTEAVGNLYYEILRRASESSAIPNQWAIAAIELSDLFLDKNVIHHTFKGDAVLAFTGIKSYLRTYTNYEYDSLTFENRSVEKTKTDYIPEFTAILTIENINNVKRILKMINRMDGLTQISENTYSIKLGNKEMDGNFYVVIKDNLFFLTNDKILATEQINSTLALERTVGEAYNSYLNMSSFGFWDASKMFKLMADGPDEKFGKDEEWEKLGQKINKGLFLAKNMEGNTANMELSLEMKNRENSSLLELLKLMDDIYILKKFKF